MDDHVELKTERLTLEPVRRRHAQALFPILSNLEAVRFWHAPPHASVEETIAYIDGLISGRARGWAIVPRGSSDAVGLVYYISDTVPVGMGYILHPVYWGRGVAGEAVSKVLEHGFDALKFDRIEFWIETKNSRSLALADRLGFVRRGNFRAKYPHRAEPHELVVLGLYAGEDSTHPKEIEEQFYSCVPILSVPDVSAAVAFYRDKLDFTLEFMHGDPPGVARLYRSDWSVPGNRVQFQTSDAPPNFASLALYFEVGAAIDALFAQFKSRGVAIEREPQTMAWGMREFAVRDCHDVLLRFGTRT